MYMLYTYTQVLYTHIHHIYIYTCICMYTYTQVLYTHIHTYMHTYTHIVHTLDGTTYLLTFMQLTYTTN
jgi:hypothetical protein